MNDLSAPTPAVLASAAFASFDFHREPVNLPRFLSEFARELAPTLTKLDAYEEMGSRKDEYVAALLKMQRQAQEEGRFCPYEILRDQNQIVGYSYPRPGDSEEIAQLREIAPLHREVLEAIRQIDPDDFERFCVRALELLGAEEGMQTQRSRDQGIDFAARVPIGKRFAPVTSLLNFEEAFNITVIGQAKAYGPGHPVGVSVVRELVGTLATFRFDRTTDSSSGLEIAFEYRLCDPIVPLLMTTGVFSSPAKMMGRRYGVILKDGAQIATFLCLHEIGIEMEQGTRIFRKEALDAWIGGW